MATETTIVANARLELLRTLAEWREVRAMLMESGHLRNSSLMVPLFNGEPYQNTDADIMLAARECAAIGEVEMACDPTEPMYECGVAITDVGYDRIKAHDAIHESAQERIA